MRRAATLLLLGVLPWLTFSAAASDSVPGPTIKLAAEGKCIAPTDVMRRNHMEMLKHQRDRTLRLGIRGEKVSLNKCIQCHAGKDTGTVVGKGEFCESCHSYAAVKLDCWDCHQPNARLQSTGVKQ